MVVSTSRMELSLFSALGRFLAITGFWQYTAYDQTAQSTSCCKTGSLLYCLSASCWWGYGRLVFFLHWDMYVSKACFLLLELVLIFTSSHSFVRSKSKLPFIFVLSCKLKPTLTSDPTCAFISPTMMLTLCFGSWRVTSCDVLYDLTASISSERLVWLYDFRLKLPP